jgi:sulfotransferase
MFNKKQYYFLSGVPRAGNTLLGSLLNQNKSISVTANSPVSDMLFTMDSYEAEDFSKNFFDPKSHSNACKGIIPNYYRDWKSNVIIDRGPWGSDDNLKLLKKYCPNKIKIIVLLRDIEEVLASFIKWSKENPGNFLDHYSNLEKKCDHLIYPGGMIHKNLGAIYNMLKEENRKYALFIKYNDLISNPEEEVRRIYKFFGVKQYKHNFKNLDAFSSNEISYTDSILGKNLHKVRLDCICRSDYVPQDYIPQGILDKYQTLNFWKNML